MRKVLTTNNLWRRSANRTLLALSLSTSLVAFGCSTNLNPGNGTPTRSGSEVRTAPTSGASTGSESAPTYPPPMTSSSRGFNALPLVNGVAAADNAAAVMASHQRVRVLGPVNPGESAIGGAIPVAGGQFNNPALITNPQITVNSSISSIPVGGITTGVGESSGIAGVTTAGTTATTSNATVTGTSTPATSSGLTLGGTVTSNAAVFTPVTGAVASTPIAASTATPVTAAGVTTATPTTVSGAVISPTAAARPLATTATTATTGTTATAASTTNTGTTVLGTATGNARITLLRSAATTATTSNATTAKSTSVRISNSNGRVTVTNVKRQQ